MIKSKLDLIEEMLKFSEKQYPNSILDVGCGIGRENNEYNVKQKVSL